MDTRMGVIKILGLLSFILSPVCIFVSHTNCCVWNIHNSPPGLVNRRKFRAKIRMPVCLYANVTGHVGVVGQKTGSQQLPHSKSNRSTVNAAWSRSNPQLRPLHACLLIHVGRRHSCSLRKEIPGHGDEWVTETHVRHLSNGVRSARGIASEPPRIMWGCAAVART